MTANPAQPPAPLLEEIYRNESRRVFATLVRLLDNNFDLAEEALHEAFAVATEKWPQEGLPENPRAWLVSTGRFKAIDIIRRQSRQNEVQAEVAARMEAIEAANAARAGESIEDDTLRLVFTCCHPAIDRTVQVPLTLREVCGLKTEEIASAFLVSTSTMAQRIVRGRAKIRDAKIPYIIPSAADLPERLDAVLTVIYLVFNEGYSASSGASLTRADLTGESIRLCRLVLELLPDPEVMGLLALMLLHESRRTARMSPEGELILLEHQDRSQWNQGLITEGQQHVARALATRRFGVYTIQAAISAVHAEATSAEETDWSQIVALYDVLHRADPSPVIELNRAVAVAMRDGPEAGLQQIDALLSGGALANYHLAHAARADLCRRLGRTSDARTAYDQAIVLAKQEPERRFLEKRRQELG